MTARLAEDEQAGGFCGEQIGDGHSALIPLGKRVVCETGNGLEERSLEFLGEVSWHDGNVAERTFVFFDGINNDLGVVPDHRFNVIKFTSSIVMRIGTEQLCIESAVDQMPAGRHFRREESCCGQWASGQLGSQYAGKLFKECAPDRLRCGQCIVVLRIRTRERLKHFFDVDRFRHEDLLKGTGDGNDQTEEGSKKYTERQSNKKPGAVCDTGEIWTSRS